MTWPPDGERRDLRHVRGQRLGVEELLHRVEPVELAELTDPGPVDVRRVGEVCLCGRGGRDLRLQAVPVDVDPLHLDAGLLGEGGERMPSAGRVVASATVIVTPDVLLDAAELPELPLPQAASTKVSTTAAATVAWPRRPRLLLSVLANAPLLRYAATAESGRGSVLAYAQSAARSDAHLRIACSTDHRIGILQGRFMVTTRIASRHPDLVSERSYVHK